MNMLAGTWNRTRSLFTSLNVIESHETIISKYAVSCND